MNAKVARKIRQHVQTTVEPEKRQEATKALKALWEKGYIKFGK